VKIVDEKPRYAIRRGGVEFTRRQWILIGAFLVADIVVSCALIVFVSLAAGSLVLSVTGLVSTLILAFVRRSY
jgi:hypothetical protein